MNLHPRSLHQPRVDGHTLVDLPGEFGRRVADGDQALGFQPLGDFRLVQARRRFCVAYGILGTFNFGKLGTVSRVSDPDFRRADRITVLKLGGLSLAYALAATLGFVLLPA